ncbi:MAG TPA: ATP-binding protein [Chroococcales cyanobacterium]
MFTRTLPQKVRIVTVISAVIQLAFVVRIIFLYQTLHGELDRSARTVELSGSMSAIANLWSAAGAVFPGSVAAPRVAAARLSEFVRLLEREFSKVLSPLPEDKRERDTVAAIQGNLHSAQHLLDQIELGDTADEPLLDSLQEVAANVEVGTARSRQLMKEFAEEQSVHQERADQLSWSLNCTLCLLIAANVEMAVLAAYLFVSGIAVKVQVLTQNLKRIASGVPLNLPISGDDELADLDRTIRRMSVSLAEAERKERAVIDNARDLIFSLNENLLFESMNPAAQLILNRNPESLLGRSLMDLVLPDYREPVLLGFRTTAASARTQRFECRFSAENGAQIDILLSAYWSEVDGIFSCTGHDLTEVRSLERMKRQFVAMISHDLRTPLSSVLSMLTAIEDGVYKARSEKGAERLQSAIENVDRMLALTDDLLEMATFEGASLSVEVRAVAVSSVINQAVASVRTFAEHRGVALSADIGECSISADPGRLVQVLVNLLSNAVKFSPFGGTVSVSSRPSSGRVRIEIADSGPGISPEDQSVIFEPYRQSVQSHSNRHREGTGLGLTICKLIVEAHGGAIGVTSAQNKGSTFWVEIPLERSELE